MVAISLASHAVAMAIRLHISATGAANWLGGLLAVTLFLSCSLDMTEDPVRRFAALAAICALPAILFGYVDDLRVFLPCAVMLCVAVAARRRIDKEA